MDHLTATSVIKLMRKHGMTIGGLASAMNIPQSRVRQVRAYGVQGTAFVQDWMQAITGNPGAGWEAVAMAYL